MFWLLLSTAYYFLRFNANIFRNTISCSCFSELICVLEMECVPDLGGGWGIPPG